VFAHVRLAHLWPSDDAEVGEEQIGDSVMESDEDKPRPARSGRKKIKIEYIQEKSRRHITFSKRRFGIMKKVCIRQR